MSDSSDELGLELRLVLERKKRRLAEHVRQARTELAGFEQSEEVRGGKHYRSVSAQRKHRALKSDLEVVEEEYALLLTTMNLSDESIPR